MQLRREKKEPATVSLQESIESSKDGTELTVMDVLQDDACMEEAVEQHALAAQLKALLQTLNGRERQVILLRYGLGGQPPLTQQQVAELLHISRSYVSRLESRALAALQQGMRAQDSREKPQ